MTIQTESSSLTSLLQTLTLTLSSASTSLPTPSTLHPPNDGISLLDTKNELLLSYLQNLSFLILLKLRNLQSTIPAANGGEAGLGLEDAVVKKLVELRVYLEKGVRPLEGRLRYQIDKVVRAAEEAERAATAQQPRKTSKKKKGSKESRHKSAAAGSEGDEASGDGSVSGTGSSDSSGSDSDASIDETAHRPNPLAFTLPSSTQPTTSTHSGKPSVYKPPKITPTAMPTTDSNTRDTDRKRTQKSAVLHNFIASEYSSTPTAEPSIGTGGTILAKGRKTISARDREKESERRRYEEENFVRLPKESKAERRKHGRGREKEGGYGGEDWGGLGLGADRIEKLVGRKKGSGGVVERSRKREASGQGWGDGRKGEGVGESWEKRRKIVERRGR
jgi:U3 small nucleolar ribonucleoprotein protein LCP5